MTQKSQWTAATRAAFIASLAECGEVRAALNTVGLSPKSAYRLRALDPDFARAWDAALLHSRQAVVAELTSRALHGWQEEVWFRGELVGTRTRHDSRLLLALLARLDGAAGKEEEARVRRAAPHFADMLAALRHDEPLAPLFAASQAEKQEEAIAQACRRQRFWHYAALMDEDLIDDVMGFGPDQNGNDDTDDDDDDDDTDDDTDDDHDHDDGHDDGDDRDTAFAAGEDEQHGDQRHDARAGHGEVTSVPTITPVASADALDATGLMPSTDLPALPLARPAGPTIARPRTSEPSPLRGCYPVLPMVGQGAENPPADALDQGGTPHLAAPPPPVRAAVRAADCAAGPLTALEAEAVNGDMAQLFQQRFGRLSDPLTDPPL